MTEIGMKETDSMIGVEWLDAIDWQLYQHTTTEEEIGDKGGEGDGPDVSNKNKKFINKKEEKNKKRENKENQKDKEKIKDKNNNLKIGCINVRGMNDNVKQGEIRKFLGKEKWDIAVISETKLKESKGRYIYMDWNAYECINSSYNNDNTKNGIIILLKKEINDRRYTIEKINGYAIKVDILFRGSQKNIRIIGIYNPNNDRPATKIIETKLAKWMNEATNLDYEMIILGDFNESANDRKKKREKPLTTTIKQHGLQDIHECLTTEKDKL
ncbi:DNase I-like protein [Rhizophagus irregularis]|nr:DNase I-like protein [Rhizophagus irregularis]